MGKKHNEADQLTQWKLSEGTGEKSEQVRDNEVKDGLGIFLIAILEEDFWKCKLYLVEKNH